MILVDANIPMYRVGGDHPLKHESWRIVENALSAGERLVTDAEVLQEICHRYGSLGRLDSLQPAFDALLAIVDEVIPVELGDVEASKDLLMRYASLSARDSLHAAIMTRHGIERIMTFDRSFDALPGIERVR
ncbi:MAG: type II toxin-antitoxin system VapC family toxin [Thermoleophilaceae bacterium]|nr:type II toxin-antitoxin system VapC family toxin [Thermoleophilaceae bacterium]